MPPTPVPPTPSTQTPNSTTKKTNRARWETFIFAGTFIALLIVMMFLIGYIEKCRGKKEERKYIVMLLIFFYVLFYFIIVGILF